jgi:hypothetical protein
MRAHFRPPGKAPIAAEPDGSAVHRLSEHAGRAVEVHRREFQRLTID